MRNMILNQLRNEKPTREIGYGEQLQPPNFMNKSSSDQALGSTANHSGVNTPQVGANSNKNMISEAFRKKVDQYQKRVEAEEA